MIFSSVAELLERVHNRSKAVYVSVLARVGKSPHPTPQFPPPAGISPRKFNLPENSTQNAPDTLVGWARPEPLGELTALFRLSS